MNLQKNTILKVASQLLMIAKRQARINPLACRASKEHWEKAFESEENLEPQELAKLISDELSRYVSDHKQSLIRFSYNPELAGLVSALSEPTNSNGPSRKYPLYVYVMGDQKAYLHQGNAKNVHEALEQFQHITEDEAPIAVLEIRNCKLFKMQEIKHSAFCPACGATAYGLKDCTCAK